MSRWYKNYFDFLSFKFLAFFLSVSMFFVYFSVINLNFYLKIETSEKQICSVLFCYSHRLHNLQGRSCYAIWLENVILTFGHQMAADATLFTFYIKMDLFSVCPAGVPVLQSRKECVKACIKTKQTKKFVCVLGGAWQTRKIRWTWSYWTSGELLPRVSNKSWFYAVSNFLELFRMSKL